jgi:hypothetical protein
LLGHSSYTKQQKYSTAPDRKETSKRQPKKLEGLDMARIEAL